MSKKLGVDRDMLSRIYARLIAGGEIGRSVEAEWGAKDKADGEKPSDNKADGQKPSDNKADDGGVRKSVRMWGRAGAHGGFDDSAGERLNEAIAVLVERARTDGARSNFARMRASLDSQEFLTQISGSEQDRKAMEAKLDEARRAQAQSEASFREAESLAAESRTSRARGGSAQYAFFADPANGHLVREFIERTRHMSPLQRQTELELMIANWNAARRMEMPSVDPAELRRGYLDDAAGLQTPSIASGVRAWVHEGNDEHKARLGPLNLSGPARPKALDRNRDKVTDVVDGAINGDRTPQSPYHNPGKTLDNTPTAQKTLENSRQVRSGRVLAEQLGQEPNPKVGVEERNLLDTSASPEIGATELALRQGRNAVLTATKGWKQILTDKDQ